MKEKSKPWTRKELSMRIGFDELAKAVIEQWNRDGRPESDRKQIEYWFKVIEQSREVKHD